MLPLPAKTFRIFKLVFLYRIFKCEVLIWIIGFTCAREMKLFFIYFWHEMLPISIKTFRLFKLVSFYRIFEKLGVDLGWVPHALWGWNFFEMLLTCNTVNINEKISTCQISLFLQKISKVMGWFGVGFTCAREMKLFLYTFGIKFCHYQSKHFDSLNKCPFI